MAEGLGDRRDEILVIVKEEGPLLPAVIGKKLGIDLTFASAMLSEMVDNKTLLLTNVKCGGSPFYYVQEQEGKLQNLVEYLNEKDKETSELLKEKKILKDQDLNPLQRVSLRQIKDYAKQVQVKIEGREELFWRWYLINEEETKRLITEYLQTKEEPISVPDSEEESLSTRVEEVSESPETQTTFEEIEDSETQAPQIQTFEGDKEEIDPLGKFLIENNFEILKQNIIRKNKEINYITKLDIKVGRITFFLKYKDKKKINDSDIALAKHEAKDLPLFFLSTGELSKKARDMLEKEFQGVVFRKL